jgi:hypothetical protein
VTLGRQLRRLDLPTTGAPLASNARSSVGRRQRSCTGGRDLIRVSKRWGSAVLSAVLAGRIRSSTVKLCVLFLGLFEDELYAANDRSFHHGYSPTGRPRPLALEDDALA